MRIFSFILVFLFSTQLAFAQLNRSNLNSYNNNTFFSNDAGLITGPDVATMNGNFITSFGVLNDTNIWTGSNNFTGGLSYNGNPVNTNGGLLTSNGALGTPTSGVLTNTTGLPLTTGVTGVLPAANGGLGTNSLTGLLYANGTSSATAIVPGTGVATALTQNVVGSGSLVLSNSPTLTGTPLVPTATSGTNTTQIASTAFVTSAVASSGLTGFRNRIINGAMDIDQRNGGASGTVVNGFTVDRWAYGATQASKGTWGQNLNSVTPPVRFPHYLGFQSSSAYSVASTDVFHLFQPIEANNIEDFASGTSSAATVTFSFQAYSSLTGTFSGALTNYALTRSYPFVYTIPTANTWTPIIITITLDTSGTWVNSGTGGSMTVHFDLGSGSNYRGTAGSWVSAGYLGVTNTVCVVCASGATFYVTGVQLENNPVATVFERRPYGTELALAQRYYWQTLSPNTIIGYAPGAGGLAYGTISNPVPMRVTPTISTTWTNANNSSVYVVTGQNIYSFQIYCSSAAAGEFYVSYSIGNTIIAEL